MDITKYVFDRECFPRYNNAIINISDITNRADKCLLEACGDCNQTFKNTNLPEDVQIYVCDRNGSEKLDLKPENLVLKKHGNGIQETYTYTDINTFLTKNGTAFNTSTFLIFREHPNLEEELNKIQTDSHFIIVTRNENTMRQKANGRCQNVSKISSNENVATEISSLLERKTFEPMTERFECITDLLSVGDSLDVDRKRKSTRSQTILPCSSGKIRKMDKSPGNEHHTQKVGDSSDVDRKRKSTRSQTILPCSSEKIRKIDKSPGNELPTMKGHKHYSSKFECSSSHHCDTERQVDDLKNKPKDEEVQEDTIIGKKAQFQRLLGEMIGMYRRSKIPESLKPDLDGPIEGKISNQIMNKLYQISHSITGYSYKYITRLQIHVLIDEIEILKPQIENELFKYGYDADSFDVVPPVDEVVPCNKILVGSRVENGNSYGTLGGFVEVISKKQNAPSCWALGSKHLLDGQTQVKIINEVQTLTADVIEETAPGDRNMKYDIAAAKVKEGDEKQCEGRFKSADGTLMKGVMSDKDVYQLDCQNVYMHGAATGKSLGIVATTSVKKRDSTETETGIKQPCQTHAEADNAVSDENNKFIYITRRKDSGFFCSEGDSGAMVCADEVDDHVELISTVNGRHNQLGLTQSLLLKEGVSYLERITESSINFFKK